MKHVLAVVCLICAAVLAQGKSAIPQTEVPAFHDRPPAKGEILPPIMTQKQLADGGYTMPSQKASYAAAAKASSVLYQLPCYCYCDRNHGHSSLHSCFEVSHGANCGVCMGEALYAYKMSKKGWTTKMIRDGIVRGDYKQMDLEHPDL